MPVRKWMVRLLVFGVAALTVTAGFLYERCTNPVAMRQQVIAKIGEHLVDVVVGLDSAHLRLLGGIAFQELRLTRGDDHGKTDFLHVPSGVIYHDKEQLLDGKIAIRRIELHRPTIRAIRRPDGRWNLAGILQPPELDKRKPTIVIQQGTILLDDGAGRPPIEIKEVSLTLINDPILTLSFRASGRSELLGQLEANGDLQRDSDEFRGAVKAREVPLGDALLDRILAHAPEAASLKGAIAAKASLNAEFAYDPKAAGGWNYTLHSQIVDGTIKNDALPFPLSAVRATIHSVDGQTTVESFEAQAGRARLVGEGKLLALSKNTDLEATVTCDALEVDASFFSNLPAAFHEIQSDYQPRGPLNFTCRMSRKGGKLARRLTIQPQGVCAVFRKFPYALDDVRGTIEQTVDPSTGTDKLAINLLAMADNKPLHVRGQIEGAAPAGVALDIWGENLEISDRLVDTLPPGPRKIARSFQPKGQFDLVATIRRDQGHEEFANAYRVRFRNAQTRYDVFPYPIENISGYLEVLPDRWQYSDFVGSHKGATFRSDGRSEITKQGERVVIEVSGTQVLLDNELEASLQPGLRQAWELLEPGGRLDFQARVSHLLSMPEPEFDVTVRPRDATICPKFFAYRLDNVTGTVRYVQGRALLNELAARHGQAKITIHRGEIDFLPQGGVKADIRDLEGMPIIPDGDFLAALPPMLRDFFAAIQLRDALALRTQLEVELPPPGSTAQPHIHWDGRLAVSDANLHAGVGFEHVSGQVCSWGDFRGEIENLDGNLDIRQVDVFDQPVKDLQGQISFRRDKSPTMLFNNLRAKLFDGMVGGEVRVEFEPQLKYELNLTASQVRLEELGRHNLMQSAEIRGMAQARLFLSGDGNGVAGIHGHGNVHVPNGRMYNLPLLLDLLKVPGLRVPDRTAFEEAHAQFQVHGPTVRVQRLDLYGNAISLSGQGEMNLDGTGINLDFYAVWGRIVQMLPPLIKEIPPEISKCLLKIKMRGKIGDVRCTKQPLPILFDPFQHMVAWMQRKQGR